MKKTKLIVSLAALSATAITPVITLASCNNSQTTTVKAIPESMLEIQSNVLMGLTESASIDSYDTLVIPESVVAINAEAFKDVFVEETNASSTIKTVVFNKNLQFIGKDAFNGCTSLTCLDFSNMQDIKLMALSLSGETVFASCSNKSGRVKLPEGITDMQKEWITTQLKNAGLPGSWFGETEAPDQETVDAINEILDAQTPCKTMTALINLVKEESLGVYDLEELQPTNANEQYVWDSYNNKVVEIDQNGNLTCGPKDENYSLPENIYIWKMVKPSEQLKVLRSSITNNNEIYADEFKSDTEYSQYLRTDYKQQWEEDKTLTFQSGLDTGNVEKLVLEYNNPEGSDATPVINTQNCELTVNGPLDSIDHYGNLTTLTVESIGSSATDDAYNEYGTVDARIVIRSGTLVAKPESVINDIVITSDDVDKIVVEQDSNIGSVYTTTDVTVGTTSDYIEIEGTTEPEWVDEEKQNPQAEPYFYAGLGSKEHPYVISTKNQLIHAQQEVNGTQETPEAPQPNLCFTLLNDVDLENTEWTPIGNIVEHSYKGIFDGKGYTIKNFKVTQSHKTEEYPYDYGYGFFGITSGTANSSFTSVSSVWSDNELDEENIAEDKYSTVIKNIVFENATVTLPNEARCIGGVVGVADNTYINNCQVKTGTISGRKSIGGITGSAAGSVIKSCKAGAEEGTLTIHAESYNVAGMIGRTEDRTPSGTSTNIAIIESETGSNCTISMNTCEGSGGFAAGFTGYAAYQQTLVVEGCVNAATVEYNGTYDDSEISGFIGFTSDSGECLVANCTNKGDIKATGDARVKNAAGIAVSPGSNVKLYNCVNKGSIVANAVNSVAGVAAGCDVSGLPTNPGDETMLKISLCRNESTTISNPLDETKKADVCDNIIGLIISDTTFANAEEVNSLIGHAGANATQITFKNCTLIDDTGSITLPSSVSTIYADRPISANITVNSNFSRINVYVPNQNITVTTQSDCEIYSYSANNTITIAEGASVKTVRVCGEGSKVINNGTVKRTIGIDGAASEGINNGTCANITFGYWVDGYQYTISSPKTFINNSDGIITGATDPNEAINNTISIYDDLIGFVDKVTIKNYGTIKYQHNDQLTTTGKLIYFPRRPFAYALGGDLTLECYANSKIISDKDNFFDKTEGDGNCKVLLKWQEGYSVTLNGASKTFAEIKQEYEATQCKIAITVEEM